MSPPRRVTVVTTSRADFGIYASVFAAMRSSTALRPDLLVSGNHVAAEWSGQERAEAAAKLAADARVPLAAVVPMPLGRGDAASVAEAMTAVTASAARVFETAPPDVLLVLGDRYEMHAVVVAASAFRVPVAHIHGGEESAGALDNAYRHSISKLSHLHFCTTELSARRLLQMGEEPWRIAVTGAPALDGLDQLPFHARQELIALLKIPDEPFLLATFHPETLAIAETLPAFEALVAALDRIGMTTVFSKANADETGQAINARLNDYERSRPWLHVRDNLGRLGFFSAMRHASAMVGNSSSGIIEAASFGLPVVNVGDRQAGRERSPNTIDVRSEEKAISEAIRRALSAGFAELCRGGGNIYSRGAAGMAICDVLERAPMGRTLLVKEFQLV